MTPSRARIKQAVLPAGRKVRRLPLGIGRGLRMGIDFHRGETSLYLGLYEIELNSHLRRIARPGYRSFDIGAQYGYDALLLARLTGAAVVSVEADPTLVPEITESVARNSGLAPITVVAGFVCAQDAGDHVSIDELASKHFVPDLIKMDIEGGEFDALEGASGVLAKRHPALLLEVHSKDLEWDCLALLRQAGYDPPTIVDPRRWLPDHRVADHNRWLIFQG